MSSQTVSSSQCSLRALSARAASVAFAVCLVAAQPARSQNAANGFDSGSTGADGAFAPVASQTVVVPDSGVFNYTTVNIPTGVTITYARNSRNTPVVILASGDVNIAGSIRLDGKPGNGNGSGGLGGPGGFNGGSAGYGTGNTYAGITGDGPGGGAGGGSAEGSAVSGGGGGGYSAVGANGGAQSGIAAGQGGPRYGTNALSPLIGGSGGGGGGARQNTYGGAGGGGGGSVLVASSTRITLSGLISVRGGDGSSAAFHNNQSSAGGGGGGGGSGGGIRLVANTIAGGGSMDVRGGSPGPGFTIGVGSNVNGGIGAQGYIRAEAYDYSGFTPSSNQAFVSIALPHPAIPVNAPRLRIVSVAGLSAPAYPLGSLTGVPDVVVPATQANPVTVELEGENLPVGTVVQVTLTPANGSRSTVQSTPLGGTVSASTATAGVALPAGMSVVSATAVVDPAALSGAARHLFIEGEQVDRIEVAATFGGTSSLTYVTRSGRRVRRLAE